MAAGSIDRVPLEPAPRTSPAIFVNPWSVVSPRLYRYEDKRWIDEFFDNGLIRLSSFETCQNYKDTIRGDPLEGVGMGYGEMPDGTSLVVVASLGQDAYLLSCSMRLDRKLQTAFGRDSAFVIMDPTAFSLAVATAMEGFLRGFEGPCFYRDLPISRALDFTMEQFRRDDGSYDMAFAQQAAVNLTTHERMLSKSKHYIDQQEYRMLWIINSDVKPYIDITAPNARQFCRRVVELDW